MKMKEKQTTSNQANHLTVGSVYLHILYLMLFRPHSDHDELLARPIQLTNGSEGKVVIAA
jgi:hypothetical protein